MEVIETLTLHAFISIKENINIRILSEVRSYWIDMQLYVESRKSYL